MAQKTSQRLWCFIKTQWLNSWATADRRAFWYSGIGHVLFVAILIWLASVDFSVNKSTKPLVIATPIEQTQAVPIVEAQAISAQDLQSQIDAYENYQEQQRQAVMAEQQRQQAATEAQKRIAEAKAKAIKEEKARKAEEARQAELKRQAEEKRKAEAQAQKEAEAKRQAEEKAQKEAEEKSKAEEQAQKEAEAKRQAEEKRKAEEARKQAEAQAQREKVLQQIAQDNASRALSRYVKLYQAAISQAWVEDYCRGIPRAQLPSVIVKDGQFVKLVGSSGNQACDQSLQRAVQQTQAPPLDDQLALEQIKNGVQFTFGQGN